LVVGRHRRNYPDSRRLGGPCGCQQYGPHTQRAAGSGCRNGRHHGRDISMITPHHAAGSLWDRWRARWTAFKDGLNEYYAGPYRQTFARAARDEEDLFMMMVFSEALGV